MIVREVKWNTESEVEVLYDAAGLVSGKEIHAPGTRKTVSDTVVKGTEVERDEQGRAMRVKGRFDSERSEFVDGEGGIGGFRTPLAIVEMSKRKIIPDPNLPTTPLTTTHSGLTVEELGGSPEATFADMREHSDWMEKSTSDGPQPVKPFSNQSVYIKSGCKLVVTNVEPILRQPHQNPDPIPEEMNWNSASLVPEPVSPVPIIGSYITGYDEEIGAALAKSDWNLYLAYRQETSGKGKKPEFERKEDIDIEEEAKRMEVFKKIMKEVGIGRDLMKKVELQKEKLRLSQMELDRLEAEDLEFERIDAANATAEKKRSKGKKAKKPVGRKPAVGDTM